MYLISVHQSDYPIKYAYMNQYSQSYLQNQNEFDNILQILNEIYSDMLTLNDE